MKGMLKSPIFWIIVIALLIGVGLAMYKKSKLAPAPPANLPPPAPAPPASNPTSPNPQAPNTPPPATGGASSTYKPSVSFPAGTEVKASQNGTSAFSVPTYVGNHVLFTVNKDEVIGTSVGEEHNDGEYEYLRIKAHPPYQHEVYVAKARVYS